MIEEIKPKDARQGRNGLQVFFVLVGALVLLMGAWFVVETFIVP